MKIEVELEPFLVPNYAIQKVRQPKGRGMVIPPTHNFSDLEVEIISELCDEFRKSVFAKSGKVDPRKQDQAKELILDYKEGYF